jgi:hypothetical protein
MLLQYVLQKIRMQYGCEDAGLLARDLVTYLDTSGELQSLAAALAHFSAAGASVASSSSTAACSSANSSFTSLTSADTAVLSGALLRSFKYKPKLNLMEGGFLHLQSNMLAFLVALNDLFALSTLFLTPQTSLTFISIKFFFFFVKTLESCVSIKSA